MAALLGDLYSMSNGAKQNNVPRLNNILLNKEKEETENTKENYLDDDISQQYSTTEQKPQVTFKQGKQVIKADGIATLEPFDAFSQEIENATNLMRSWRGDGYTPTPSEVQAIRVIASTSSNPKDDVARFVTAAAIHDRIPSITLENAYNNIDSISQYYVGKDYTAFDTSLLEKIDAGFKYYDIMQDMAKWAELDQRNDPKATELEAQIQEKLVALGDMKSAIPTSLFDSISNAVAENFAYMAVPAVKSAFSTALTKTALTKIVSVANIIPSPTIKAAIASMSVGAGILTQYNELSTLQAAQSYWDYMHDYEGQAEANKATAAIFSSLNGIFVGLTETFLDGVTSRAAGKLISKTAGKTVDQLGVNMLINLDSSGSIGRLGRSIYDWATGAIDEGFVNELPQTLFDELMTAAYKSSIDIPVDFNPGETFKEALNSAATGIVVGAVYGSLGIHSSMVNDRNTAIKLRNTAVKSNNYQEYIYQSADYKPEGVSDEVFDEARKRVWEKWENDKYELLKGTVYESETIAQEELYSTTTEEGEELAPLPSGEVYRTTDNKLYKETIEDKDGSYVVYFGNKESRAVYGNVAIDTDGDTLTVKSVRVRNGYENIRSEMVLDAISDTRTSETNIEWNTTTPALTAIKEDIINSNPNGKEAGLNYSTIPNSKLKTLESEIQKAFPSLNSQEVKVSAVLYSIADKDNAISDINKGKAFAPTSEIPGDIKAPLGIRGAANKAQALIYTAQNSDASTFTHELFHVVSSLRPDDSAALSNAIRTVLDNEDERQQLAQFIDNNIQIWGAGVSSEEVLKSLDSLTGDEKTWSIPIEEHLARLYEAYRASQSSIDHNLPTGIKNILIKLADAIKKVYRALRDNVPINSNIASAFDKMMGLDNATSTNGINQNLNSKYDNILYQTESGAIVNDNGTLVLTHELSEYKLEKIDELGGMPMPSLAISKPGISSDFGDIILIGSADLARRVIERGYVYGRDIWSPMVPMPEYTLTDKNKKMINSWLASTGTHVTLDRYYSHQYSNPEEISRLLSASEDIKKAYLNSKGIELEIPYKDKGEGLHYSIKNKAVEYVSKHPIDYDNYDEYVNAVAEYIRPEVEKLIESESKISRKKMLRIFYLNEKTKLDKLIEYAESPDEKIVDTDALSKIIESKAPEQDVKAWIYENISPYYSEPFVTIGKKKYPYNIENVFKSMIHDSTVASAQNGNFVFNDGLARSYAARKLTSRAMIADNEYLLSQEESEELNKLHEAFRIEAAKRYAYPNSFEAFNDANRALGKYLASGHRTDAQLKKIFGSYDFSVDQTFISMVNNLAESIDNMGRKYFEAKPAEIMQISDFSAALIPQNISEKAKDILAKSRIDVFAYSDKTTAVNDYLKVADNNILFQEVVDKELLSKLESEETIKAYRAMQLVDGKLYPPMAAIVDGKRVQAAEFGKWYVADENPNLASPDIDEKTGKQKVDKEGNLKWNFTLVKGGTDIKGKKLKDIDAAYNPYWHTSLSPLNDQFTTAYKRGNLVTVEVEIPKSELTSGYRAERAKDAVGLVDWKTGPVSSKLAKAGKPRIVMLSRYNKIVRIIPDSEVASKIAEMLKGTDIGIPANTVTPSLAKELLNLGVNVFLEDYTAKFYGKDYINNLLNSLEDIDSKESAKKALLSDAVVYQGPVTDYSNSTLDAPVFDAYIEQGVADAIEYEKLLENTAMIEQEVDDYGTRSREEADPFYVPSDFKPADNRQDIKGNIIDNSYDWTYEEFVKANAPEVYYSGSELEKDNQFIESLNNEETLRRYLAIIGEIIHHNTTAVNAGYQTEYNKTYHHEEKVQIIVPFKDQYYRDGLSERMLKQITNLDIRKASEYALNGKEWPKTTGLREAVIKELTDNARYYRNILAILTRDKQMLPSTLIEAETELAIPERDKLDLMSISELSDLAKKIKREDIAAQIEAGKLKVKGDVDEAYLAEISSVINDQKEQIRKNEDNIKGLESSNKELSSNLAKIQQTLDEREKLIVSSQKILDNINSAITNDISSGRKDIDKQYADLMAEYNNLTDEEYYQKRATAKGSREKGKAEGARLGTMDYMSDMKRMFPYLFEKDGKSLYWTAGKSTNDNKQIRENINNRIEQIKQELTGLKIDMANYSIRSLMLNSSKLDEMLAMTKNNVNGLTKILTTEEVNNWNSKLNELSEKNKELKKELNAAKLSKNRKDNKIDALKEQLEKSKEDQSLLAKWIAAREKNNQAKLEKKIVDEQREIYAERISKLKEKSDLEIKSIKATIAEKQAQKKALDLIKRTKQKLANEIMKPVNLKVVDYDTAAEAILAIQALIDPNFRREWIYDLKTDVEQQSGGQTMTIQQAKDYFNSLDDAQRIDLSQYLSQDLIDRLTEQKRPLNDWTIDELMTLARQVNDLKNRGREVLSAKKDLEKARTRQIQKAIINALKHQGFNKKDKDNNSNIPGSLDSSRRERSFRAKYYNARFTTLRMQEIAQLLDGGYGNKGLAYKLLVDDKRYHQNMRDRKIEERFSALDELFTDKAIDAMAEKVTVDLGDGLIKDFTVDQLAYAYLSQRDESTKDAVRYGALLSPEEKGTSIEKSIDIETGEAINQFLMNDQVIADDNELIQVANQRYNKLLEAAEKELADRGLMELVEAISNDFNNPNNALRLNRACIEAYNTPLDMREYYLAIRRVDSNGKELNDSFVANFFDPVTNSIPVNPEQGFRIKRLNISPRHQTNIDMSLINVWSNAVRTQEHLIEHAAYIKQLHNVFNFYGSKEVVSAMDNAFGTALRREIAEYIDIVSNPYKGNKIEGKDKLIRTLRGNIGSAYLGWKMSGIVLQAITSPFPGLSELNPAELIGAYMQIARHPIEAIKMINDKSIMMKNRTMNMIIDESLQRRSKWDRNKAQKAFDKFEEVGQLGLTLVDRYAVAGSWLGMYYKTLNANIAAGMSSDVAEQSAIKTADDFILRTQPVGDKTELASMFRGNNEAMKALLQFQTSLNVIWNNLTADTLGFVHNGEYSKLIGTISGYILAGTILGMVSDGFSDEDNRWWKKLIYWAMSQELSSMPVFGSAIDNIAEKLITGNASYTTQGVSIFPAVDKVFQSISAISKGDWQKALQRATEGAEIFTGLPYSGIKEIKEVFNQKSLAPLLGRR